MRRIVFFACLMVLTAVIFSSEPLKRASFNQGLLSKKDFKSGKSKEIVLRDLDSGRENNNNPPPFDFIYAEKTINEAQETLEKGIIINIEAKEKLQKSVDQYKNAYNKYKN
ncbi:MAG: hypothetical protein N2445_08060, partial [Acidobacteria bacterium]|nr:hypothetical protein [Acidobacteriota bacterium]